MALQQSQGVNVVVRNVDQRSEQWRGLLKVVKLSFLDPRYQWGDWAIEAIDLVGNQALEVAYQQKLEEIRAQLGSGYKCKEVYLFTCYRSNELLDRIVNHGLEVRPSSFNYLGDSSKGVNLCKHADIQLKAAEGTGQQTCWLVMYKVALGRMRPVVPDDSAMMQPMAQYDCFCSSIAADSTHQLGLQAVRSQIFVYDYSPRLGALNSTRPRQVLPYARFVFQRQSKQVPRPISQQPGTVAKTKRSTVETQKSKSGAKSRPGAKVDDIGQRLINRACSNLSAGADSLTRSVETVTSVAQPSPVLTSLLMTPLSNEPSRSIQHASFSSSSVASHPNLPPPPPYRPPSQRGGGSARGSRGHGRGGHSGIYQNPILPQPTVSLPSASHHMLTMASQVSQQFPIGSWQPGVYTQQSIAPQLVTSQPHMFIPQHLQPTPVQPLPVSIAQDTSSDESPFGGMRLPCIVIQPDEPSEPRSQSHVVITTTAPLSLPTNSRVTLPPQRRSSQTLTTPSTRLPAPPPGMEQFILPSSNTSPRVKQENTYRRPKGNEVIFVHDSDSENEEVIDVAEPVINVPNLEVPHLESASNTEQSVPNQPGEGPVDRLNTPVHMDSLTIPTTQSTTATPVSLPGGSSVPAAGSPESSLEVTPYTEFINLGNSSKISPYKPQTQPSPSLNDSTEDDGIPDLVSPFKNRRERTRLIAAKAARRLPSILKKNMIQVPNLTVSQPSESDKSWVDCPITAVETSSHSSPLQSQNDLPSQCNDPEDMAVTEERSPLQMVRKVPKDCKGLKPKHRLQKALKKLVSETAVVTLCKDGTCRLRLEKTFGPGKENNKSSKISSKLRIELEASVDENTKQMVNGLFKDVQVTDVQGEIQIRTPKPQRFPPVKRPERMPIVNDNTDQSVHDGCNNTPHMSQDSQQPNENELHVDYMNTFEDISDIENDPNIEVTYEPMDHMVIEVPPPKATKRKRRRRRGVKGKPKHTQKQPSVSPKPDIKIQRVDQDEEVLEDLDVEGSDLSDNCDSNSEYSESVLIVSPRSPRSQAQAHSNEVTSPEKESPVSSGTPESSNFNSKSNPWSVTPSEFTPVEQSTPKKKKRKVKTHLSGYIKRRRKARGKGKGQKKQLSAESHHANETPSPYSSLEHVAQVPCESCEDKVEDGHGDLTSKCTDEINKENIAQQSTEADRPLVFGDTTNDKEGNASDDVELATNNENENNQEAEETHEADAGQLETRLTESEQTETPQQIVEKEQEKPVEEDAADNEEKPLVRRLRSRERKTSDREQETTKKRLPRGKRKKRLLQEEEQESVEEKSDEQNKEPAAKDEGTEGEKEQEPDETEKTDETAEKLKLIQAVLGSNISEDMKMKLLEGIRLDLQNKLDNIDSGSESDEGSLSSKTRKDNQPTDAVPVATICEENAEEPEASGNEELLTEKDKDFTIEKPTQIEESSDEKNTSSESNSAVSKKLSLTDYFKRKPDIADKAKNLKSLNSIETAITKSSSELFDGFSHEEGSSHVPNPSTWLEHMKRLNSAPSGTGKEKIDLLEILSKGIRATSQEIHSPELQPFISVKKIDQEKQPPKTSLENSTFSVDTSKLDFEKIKEALATLGQLPAQSLAKSSATSASSVTMASETSQASLVTNTYVVASHHQQPHQQNTATQEPAKKKKKTVIDFYRSPLSDLYDTGGSQTSAFPRTKPKKRRKTWQLPKSMGNAGIPQPRIPSLMQIPVHIGGISTAQRMTSYPSNSSQFNQPQYPISTIGNFPTPQTSESSYSNVGHNVVSEPMVLNTSQATLNPVSRTDPRLDRRQSGDTHVLMSPKETITSPVKDMSNPRLSLKKQFSGERDEISGSSPPFSSGRSIQEEEISLVGPVPGSSVSQDPRGISSSNAGRMSGEKDRWSADTSGSTPSYQIARAARRRTTSGEQRHIHGFVSETSPVSQDPRGNLQSNRERQMSGDRSLIVLTNPDNPILSDNNDPVVPRNRERQPSESQNTVRASVDQKRRLSMGEKPIVNSKDPRVVRSISVDHDGTITSPVKSPASSSGKSPIIQSPTYRAGSSPRAEPGLRSPRDSTPHLGHHHRRHSKEHHKHSAPQMPPPLKERPWNRQLIPFATPKPDKEYFWNRANKEDACKDDPRLARYINNRNPKPVSRRGSASSITKTIPLNVGDERNAAKGKKGPERPLIDYSDVSGPGDDKVEEDMEQDRANLEPGELLEFDGEDTDGNAQSTSNTSPESKKASSKKREVPITKGSKAASAWSSILVEEKSCDQVDTSDQNMDIGHVESQVNYMIKMLRHLKNKQRDMLKHECEKAVLLLIKQIQTDSVYGDPTKGIEPERRERLIASGNINQLVLDELCIEKNLFDLKEQRGMCRRQLEDIKSQLDEEKRKQKQGVVSMVDISALEKQSQSLQKTIWMCELKQEVLHSNLYKLKRYQKSHLVEVLPDDLRLNSEVGKFISVEGALLFIWNMLDVKDCQRLYALKMEIETTMQKLENLPEDEVFKRRQLNWQLGWLHLERRSDLARLGIPDEQNKLRMTYKLMEKIIWYRTMVTELETADLDSQTKADLLHFVSDRLFTVDHHIKVLRIVQKDDHGQWVKRPSSAYSTAPKLPLPPRPPADPHPSKDKNSATQKTPPSTKTVQESPKHLNNHDIETTKAREVKSAEPSERPDSRSFTSIVVGEENRSPDNPTVGQQLKKFMEHFQHKSNSDTVKGSTVEKLSLDHAEQKAAKLVDTYDPFNPTEDNSGSPKPPVPDDTHHIADQLQLQPQDVLEQALAGEQRSTVQHTRKPVYHDISSKKDNTKADKPLPNKAQAHDFDTSSFVTADDINFEVSPEVSDIDNSGYVASSHKNQAVVSSRHKKTDESCTKLVVSEDLDFELTEVNQRKPEVENSSVQQVTPVGRSKLPKSTSIEAEELDLDLDSPSPVTETTSKEIVVVEALPLNLDDGEEDDDASADDQTVATIPQKEIIQHQIVDEKPACVYEDSSDDEKKATANTSESVASVVVAEHLDLDLDLSQPHTGEDRTQPDSPSLTIIDSDTLASHSKADHIHSYSSSKGPSQSDESQIIVKPLNLESDDDPADHSDSVQDSAGKTAELPAGQEQQLKNKDVCLRTSAEPNPKTTSAVKKTANKEPIIAETLLLDLDDAPEKSENLIVAENLSFEFRDESPGVENVTSVVESIAKNPNDDAVDNDTQKAKSKKCLEITLKKNYQVHTEDISDDELQSEKNYQVLTEAVSDDEREGNENSTENDLSFTSASLIILDSTVDSDTRNVSQEGKESKLDSAKPDTKNNEALKSQSDNSLDMEDSDRKGLPCSLSESDFLVVEEAICESSPEKDPSQSTLKICTSSEHLKSDNDHSEKNTNTMEEVVKPKARALATDFFFEDEMLTDEVTSAKKETIVKEDQRAGERFPCKKDSSGDSIEPRCKKRRRSKGSVDTSEAREHFKEKRLTREASATPSKKDDQQTTDKRPKSSKNNFGISVKQSKYKSAFHGKDWTVTQPLRVTYKHDRKRSRSPENTDKEFYKRRMSWKGSEGKIEHRRPSRQTEEGEACPVSKGRGRYDKDEGVDRTARSSSSQWDEGRPGTSHQQDKDYRLAGVEKLEEREYEEGEVEEDWWEEEDQYEGEDQKTRDDSWCQSRGDWDGRDKSSWEGYKSFQRDYGDKDYRFASGRGQHDEKAEDHRRSRKYCWRGHTRENRGWKKGHGRGQDQGYRESFERQEHCREEQQDVSDIIRMANHIKQQAKHWYQSPYRKRHQYRYSKRYHQKQYHDYR